MELGRGGAGGAHGKEEKEEGGEEVEEEEEAADPAAWKGRPGRYPRRPGESWPQTSPPRRTRKGNGASGRGLPAGRPPRAPPPRWPTACPQTSRAALLPGRGAVGAETRGGRPWRGRGSPGPRLRSSPGRLAAQFLPKSRPYPRAPRRRLLSPLCNRRVKKCEKRALCYLFGSRKFMPS